MRFISACPYLFQVSATWVFVAVSIAVAKSAGIENEDQGVIVSPRKSGAGIAFVSNRYKKKEDDNFEICTISEDGSQQTRLTNNTTSDAAPSFSSDGRKIVFMSFRNGNAEVYLMNSDGSGSKRLTNTPSWDGDPSFSPDGHKIIFVSNRNGSFQLFTMNSDGSGVKRLSSLKGIDVDVPSYSPDGRKIVFQASIAADPYGNESRTYIYLINSDGTHPIRLGGGTEPAFSPDGHRILFSNIGVWIMDTNGTNKRQLTRSGAGDGHPAFNSDGSKIAFESISSRRTARGNAFAEQQGIESKIDIYVMNVDGTNITRLTKTSGDNTAPTWRPSNTASVPTPTPTPLPQLTTPVPTNVAGNPLQSFDSTSFQGQLLYAFNDLRSSPYPSYLFSYKTSGSASGSAMPIANPGAAFRIKGLEGVEGDFVFDPQFSPDGAHALVKLGDPVARLTNAFNFYHLYLWDLQANQISPLSARELFFRSVSWSPDGNYVTYIAGGDAEGNVSDGGEPLRLYVCDRRTGEEHLIAQNNGVRFNVAWAAPHTLLYTTLSTAKQQANTKAPEAPRPNTYAASVEDGKSTLLIRDGQRPTASPDGQWIAFFGSGNPNKPFPLNDDWIERPGGASLSVIRRDGTGRKALTREGGSYPFVVWEPDNQHLLTVKDVPDAPSPQAEIKEWDITTGRFRRIKTLQGTIKPLQVSKDANFLITAVTPTSDSKQGQETHFLQAIDLKTGNISMLARFKGDAGFDWFDWHESATP